MTGSKSRQARLKSNVVWNISYALLNALSGFLVLPLLVRQLGTDSYGLWTLIGAVIAVSTLLDFGLVGAAGRLIAGFRLDDSIEQVNRIVTTSFVVMFGACLLTCLFTIFSTFLFFDMFYVPSSRVVEVKHALILLGIGTAIVLLFSPAGALLWGYERFDLICLIDNLVIVIRTALLFGLLASDSSLTDLALITVLPTLAGLLGKIGFCYRIEPRLSFQPKLYSSNIVRQLFEFGSWFSVLNITSTLSPQIGPTIIGNSIGPNAVTHFAIPRQIVLYSSWFTQAATQVVIPWAAQLHFGDKHSEKQELFLVGGKLCLALSLFFVGGVICLGNVFLGLWQPGLSGATYPILVILVLGEAFPMSQWITNSIIVGMGKHRAIALVGITEGFVAAALCLTLVEQFGLLGVSIALASTSFLFRGLIQLLYGCRIIGISPALYAKKVVLPMVLVCSIVTSLFGSAELLMGAYTWIGFLVAGTCYAALYWPIMTLCIFGWEGSKITILKFVRRR